MQGNQGVTSGEDQTGPAGVVTPDPLAGVGVCRPAHSYHKTLTATQQEERRIAARQSVMEMLDPAIRDRIQGWENWNTPADHYVSFQAET